MSACPVCHHPERIAIEDTLRGAGKVAWRAVAQRYGVDHLALMNHKRWHMERTPATWHESIMRGALPTGSAEVEPLMTPADEGSKPADMTFQVMRRPDGADVDEPTDDACGCFWCQMSTYQRLLKAWSTATTADKEKFCVETRTMDVPF